ncbi:hypothetical protein BST36_06675 [Mycolicibacterium moriokaense]|jgi:hypothetical protein|nr:hypothetical protein BST36_06675 [Mycolicibacterium moriokaense]
MMLCNKSFGHASSGFVVVRALILHQFLSAAGMGKVIVALDVPSLPVWSSGRTHPDADWPLSLRIIGR